VPQDRNRNQLEVVVQKKKHACKDIDDRLNQRHQLIIAPQSSAWRPWRVDQEQKFLKVSPQGDLT
jgi:hypothetical protein